MTVIDEDVGRLWALLTELSAQLSSNREHCDALKRQCDQLKNQAVHTSTGFTLRRFNVDITKEQFDSEIERFNATLVLENQALQYENRQLSMLLKDYEGTLDNIMAKFRGFAASTQQYELESSRHYEGLLLGYAHGQIPASITADGLSVNDVAEGNEGAASSDAAPHGSGGPTHSMVLQMHLANLATLVRKAFRSVHGEEPEHSESEDEEGSSSSSSSSAGGSDVGSGVRVDQTNVGTLAAQFDFERLRQLDRPRSVASSAARTRVSGRTALSSGGARRKRANSQQDRCEGGYLRLLSDNGHADTANAALERDTEIERLNKENSALREMLGIAGNLPPDPKGELINPPSILQSPWTAFDPSPSQAPTNGEPRRRVSLASPPPPKMDVTKSGNYSLRNSTATGSAIDDDDDEDDEEDDEDSDDDGHTYLEDISLARQQQAASSTATTPEMSASPPKPVPPKLSPPIVQDQEDLADFGVLQRVEQGTTPASPPRCTTTSPPPRSIDVQPKSPIKPIISPPRPMASAQLKPVLSPPRAATPAIPHPSTAPLLHSSPKIARTGLTTIASTALPATVSTTNARGNTFAASDANATTDTQ